jgi:hypothetical protein
MFFKILELVIILAGLAFIAHQLIIPAMLGRPLFSWFRKSEAQLLKERAEALQEYDEAEIESQIKRVREAAKQVKKDHGL